MYEIINFPLYYSYMFYYQVNDVLLLEEELKKLKATYAHALKRPEASPAIADLRKMIKALTGRINKLSSK